MSTLTMPLNGLDRSGSTETNATEKNEGGFFAQLIRDRERKAERETLSYLASQTDERLAGLGFNPERIQAIRSGKL